MGVKRDEKGGMEGEGTGAHTTVAPRSKAPEGRVRVWVLGFGVSGLRMGVLGFGVRDPCGKMFAPFLNMIAKSLLTQVPSGKMSMLLLLGSCMCALRRAVTI